MDHSQIVQLECPRAGIGGATSTWGPPGATRPETVSSQGRPSVAARSAAPSRFVVMATDDEIRFSTIRPVAIADRQLTPIELESSGGSPHVRVAKEGVVFDTDGWYEVLLRVDWDSTIAAGTRFSHTKIPGQEPLHSEAIDALVLAQLSQGRQLLRGNSLFGPDRTTSLVLEVWQDSGQPLAVRYAELVIRELRVPWLDE